MSDESGPAPIPAEERSSSAPEAVADGGGSVTTRRRMIEIASALLLALAAVAAAWSGYQSARWGGVQATDTAEANAARLESSRAAATGGQLVQIDVAMFSQAVNAFASGNEELLTFYEERFRDEFKPAYAEWRATEPGTNPDAPLSPFELSSYAVSELDESRRLQAVAEQESADSREARKRANSYTIMVVLLAAALFFAGISTRFETDRSRLVLLGVGTTLFLAVVVVIASLPKSVSL